MKKPVIFFLLLLCLNCQHDNKTEQISSEQLETGLEVYTTFLSLMYMDTLSVQNSNDLLDSALTMHNMKKEDFINVIEYFKKHPDNFNKALTQINEHLNEMTDSSSK
ncbi:hypothetical protein JXQ31_04255 [candidate division KSB1 bacterium]|nr:hypothetical protein [candidate division KSB1 bacterium]